MSLNRAEGVVDDDIDANTRAIFGRSYAAEPDVLVKELAVDEAIKVADTQLLTVPNQLGVDYKRSRARKHPPVRRSGTRLALTANCEPGTQRFRKPLYTLLSRALPFDGLRADARNVLRQSD